MHASREERLRARRVHELAGWSADGTERVVELFGITLPEVRYVKAL